MVSRPCLLLLLLLLPPPAPPPGPPDAVLTRALPRCWQGWRDWNQFGCQADQAMMERTFHAMVDTSRSVNGTPTSLRELGYTDVGLDDCWQATAPDGSCGSHGPEGWTYHDEFGRPLIDETKFPDMKARHRPPGPHHQNPPAAGGAALALAAFASLNHRVCVLFRRR